MATFKRNGDIHLFRDKFVAGIWSTMATTAIPQHAASARSKDLKPTVFPKATRRASRRSLRLGLDQMLLPRGLRLRPAQQPADGVLRASADCPRRARARGRGAPVDIIHSLWDCTFEPAESGKWALRLGLRQIKGIGEADAKRLFAAADETPAPTSILPSEPAAWWHSAAQDSEAHAMALLPEMPLGEHVVEDYASLSLTLKRHLLAFLRADLAGEGLVTAADLAHLPVDRRLSIAGIVLIRQRPRQRERRRLHHRRGRDRDRQSDRLARQPRALPPGRTRRHSAALHGQVAARGGGDPCRRRSSRGHHPAPQYLARPYRLWRA